MLTLEELSDALLTLQLDLEALRDENRHLRSQLDLIIDNSTEWIPPRDAMKLLGVKSTQLERLRQAGRLECRRRATGRWEYTRRSVLRLTNERLGDLSAERLSPKEWQEREEKRAYYRQRRQAAGLDAELIAAPVI